MATQLFDTFHDAVDFIDRYEIENCVKFIRRSSRGLKGRGPGGNTWLIWKMRAALVTKVVTEIHTFIFIGIVMSTRQLQLQQS